MHPLIPRRKPTDPPTLSRNQSISEHEQSLDEEDSITDEPLTDSVTGEGAPIPNMSDPGPSRSRPPRENSSLRESNKIQPAGSTVGKRKNVKFEAPAESDIEPEKDEEKTKLQGNATNKLANKFIPAKRSKLWDIYAQRTTEGDKELVEDWDRYALFSNFGVDANTPATNSAALFSAISTGFLLESSKNLRPDETVLAIQDLTRAIQSNPTTPSGPFPSSAASNDPFRPTISTIFVNCMWFASLCLSISVSLFAMLAKRWCYEFKSKRTGTAYERAMKRQASWDAIEEWKVKLFIDQLPTLMHGALILFFVGLVIYLSEMNRITMIVATVLVGLTMAVYGVLTLLRIWFPSCPMATPFTQIIQDGIWYLPRFKSRNPGLSIWDFPKIWMGALLRNQLVSWQDILGYQRGFFIFLTKVWAKGTFGFLRVAQCSTDPRDRWVMKGHGARVGETRPCPLPKDFPSEFRAIAWVLGNSNERETIEVLLNHVSRFPEIILHSNATGAQLYAVASMTAEHFNRFHQDAGERPRTVHFKGLCSRMFYLTTRPWLHQSTNGDSSRGKIEQLRNKYYQQWKEAHMFMKRAEVESQIVAINSNKMDVAADIIPWMEDIAGKVALGCVPKSGFKICIALGKALLNKSTELETRNLHTEAHLTLWWIFLINSMNASNGCWPGDGTSPDNAVAASSAHTLILSYFRDSQKRQENHLWLKVVGISSLLYTMSCCSNGELEWLGEEYVLSLITTLRSALCVPLMDSTDPFAGGFPVYHGAEVRLYQFDSVHYALDALRHSVTSLSAKDPPFLHDLKSLSEYITQLRDVKALFSPEPGKPIDNGLVAKHFKIQETNHPPDILLAAGLFRFLPSQLSFSLDQATAKALSKILPGLIFGQSNGSSSPASPGPASPTKSVSVNSVSSNISEGYVGIASSAVSHSYAQACSIVAALAWLPLRYHAESFQNSFVAEFQNHNYMRDGALWKPICNAGLLQMHAFPDAFFNLSLRFGFYEPGLAGNFLYIKAGLLDRLYSFSEGDTDSPNILEWSIALSKQVVVLLPFWERTRMDQEDRFHIIATLGKLVDALLSAFQPGAPQEKPTSGRETSGVGVSAFISTSAGDQLKMLVESNILSILASPFSPRFEKPNFAGTSQYDRLAVTINKLARETPRLGSDVGHTTPDYRILFDDILLSRTKTNNASQGDIYLDIVDYYKNRVDRDNVEISPMLQLVMQLQEAMAKQNTIPPVPLSFPASNDHRIDIP